MPAPAPPNNPLYRNSLFPKAVDTLTNQPDPETADGLMAVQGYLTGTTPLVLNASLSSPASVTPGNSLVPGSALWSGTGVPSTALGANGDYYFRTDGAASAHIYFKAAGAWTALV
jgi:hypothetical protein